MNEDILNLCLNVLGDLNNTFGRRDNKLKGIKAQQYVPSESYTMVHYLLPDTHVYIRQ